MTPDPRTLIYQTKVSTGPSSVRARPSGLDSFRYTPSRCALGFTWTIRWSRHAAVALRARFRRVDSFRESHTKVVRPSGMLGAARGSVMRLALPRLVSVARERESSLRRRPSMYKGARPGNPGFRLSPDHRGQPSAPV